MAKGNKCMSGFEEKELRLAIDKSDVERIRDMVEWGVNVLSESGSFTRTPLSFAITYNKLDVVKLLIHYGADIQTKDRWGDTPLISAINNDEFEIAKELVFAGANICASAFQQGQSKWGEKWIEAIVPILQKAKQKAQLDNLEEQIKKLAIEIEVYKESIKLTAN